MGCGKLVYLQWQLCISFPPKISFNLIRLGYTLERCMWPFKWWLCIICHISSFLWTYMYFLSFPAIGGITGDILEQNAQMFNQISANFGTFQVKYCSTLHYCSRPYDINKDISSWYCLHMLLVCVWAAVFYFAIYKFLLLTSVCLL